MQWRVILPLVALLFLGGIAYWYYSNMQPTRVDFIEQGALVINNPGMPQEVWHLVYEQPGSPALTAILSFDAQSKCATDGGLAPCILSEGVLDKSWHGKTVRVTGFTEGAQVRVQTLEVASETGKLVHLYFYKGAQDNFACSPQGLVGVDRILPPEATVAEAIKLLLRGELTDEERAEGITSEFPLADVMLESAILRNGVLTLTLRDPQGQTTGGSCRVSVMRAQLEATAKEFSGVSQVRIVPDTLFQP